MENIVRIKNDGNDEVVFDYNQRIVEYNPYDWEKYSLIVPIKIPFEDITGIEVSKKRWLRASESCLIISNKRIINPSITIKEYEISHFGFTPDIYEKCRSAFEDLAKELNISINDYKTTSCTLMNDDGRYNSTGVKRLSIDEAIKGKEKQKEHRCKCNVCGKVFCYNEDDIKENNSNRMIGAVASIGAIGSVANGSMYNAYENNKIANSATGKIIDFNRCPSCNSTDITTLTGDEWESIHNISKSPENIKVPTSSAEEILKFKELLDAGIITQEEFDAKKKQLLGL